MPNLSILLNAILTATDTSLSPSPTIFTRNLNNPNLTTGLVFFAQEFFQAANTGSAVPLPAAICWIGYVKNLDAATNLTVNWTPVSGSAQNFVLVPGGLFIYFQPTEAAGGFSAMTLTAAAGTISAEVFVAK